MRYYTASVILLTLLCQWITSSLLGSSRPSQTTTRTTTPTADCPVCPSASLMPHGSAFDWLYQLPRICLHIPDPHSGSSRAWTLFDVPLDLSNSWQTPGAPNNTEFKACLRIARKNYRRVRALWHPVADRKLRTEASLEKHAFEGSDGTARNPTTAPGLRPMFNLSLAQIAVISSIIDDVYETAKFHVITHWFRGLRRKYWQKHKSWILDGGQAMPDVRQDVEWERRRQMHISRLMDDDGARYLEIPTWQHAMEDVGYD
ncbi:hypothetical protein IWX91DRAFT_406945 [Phyllosticta citricarpa]